MTTKKAYLYDASTPQNYLEIQDLTVIGSDDTCQLKIPEAGVPPRLCRIERREDQFIIRDLRSGTATLVNDTQIAEAYLKNADCLTIGSKSYIFTYQPQTEFSSFPLNSKNESWQKTLSTLPNVAKTDFPVLLLGPSGSGKEILSKNLHDYSSRSMGPFISVNCSALTETLVESELFGHIKGSFTGAISDRKGAFESARGGTLFLDEIGDLPYAIQAKLLRALENNEIRPVGADRCLQTDVRIIAATHQDLNDKIRMGQFRADLYFRLNVITVRTPSLEERAEDFDDLLYSFAKKMRVRFSFSAIQKLKKHPWVGNIRELRNTVARASALFPQTLIEEAHVEQLLEQNLSPLKNGLTATTPELPVIKEIERQMIIKRLTANRGNQRRTANDLGMPKSTLHDRLKQYQINPLDYQQMNA